LHQKGPAVLAHLPLPWLLLMAACATALFGWEMHRCAKHRAVTVAMVVASVACCLGMIVIGGVQPQHYSAPQMLVLYSFTWTGAAIGWHPSKKMWAEWLDEWRRGIRRDHYAWPRKYMAILLCSTLVAAFAGIILSS
ncbi:hypothetical protein, partial [Streptomyces thermoviolaceus]|uniref:hypothetical protein n=1 Tax=Streptomyces thermoviolaceus TaxID=1952 RepID=UPI0019D22C45